LVRVDLPMGEALTAMPGGARIAPIAAAQNLVDAKFLGMATSADPQVQGQGFLFLAETNSLLPGAAVTAYLTVGGKPKSGVVVPGSALVRFEGEVFIYVQKAEDKFEREEVKLDVPLKNGWLVTSELTPGEKIVVTGAQQLLSEELKSRSSEE
jgi:multidrug efflux pump subunit AcrA (membrane-fusion protein)